MLPQLQDVTPLTLLLAKWFGSSQQGAGDRLESITAGANNLFHACRP